MIPKYLQTLHAAHTRFCTARTDDHDIKKPENAAGLDFIEQERFSRGNRRVGRPWKLNGSARGSFFENGRADHPRINRALRVRRITVRGHIRPLQRSGYFLPPGRHWTDSELIIKAPTDPHDCPNYDHASSYCTECCHGHQVWSRGCGAGYEDTTSLWGHYNTDGHRTLTDIDYT